MKRLKDFIPSFYFEEAERAEKQNPSNFEKFIEVIDILLGQLLDLIIKYKTFIDQRKAPLNYLLDVLGNFKLQAVSRPKEAAMLLWVIRNSAGTKRLYEKILPILIELERIKLYNAWVLSDNNTQQIVPETQIANTSLFTPNQYPIKKIFIMRDFAIPENLIFLMRELYRRFIPFWVDFDFILPDVLSTFLFFYKSLNPNQEEDNSMYDLLRFDRTFPIYYLSGSDPTKDNIRKQDEYEERGLYFIEFLEPYLKTQLPEIFEGEIIETEQTNPYILWQTYFFDDSYPSVLIENESYNLFTFDQISGNQFVYDFDGAPDDLPDYNIHFDSESQFQYFFPDTFTYHTSSFDTGNNIDEVSAFMDEEEIRWNFYDYAP